MTLDIRLPLGLLLALLGALLIAQGLFADAALNARSLGYNVNLWWGIVLLVVGLLFAFFGRRAKR